MGNQRTEFLKNTYYHVYNHSLNDAVLYHNEEEYNRFNDSMLTYLKQYKHLKLISYSFLPTHIHLVFKNMRTGFDLSHFMKKLQGSYATWYRKNYPSELKQPLFQGRFKARLLENEHKFFEALSYVNYNPLKHKLVKNISDHTHSSYNKLKQTGPHKFLEEIVLEIEGVEY